jgi:hypothetical protein
MTAILNFVELYANFVTPTAILPSELGLNSNPPMPRL